ncbi:MAG TPA: hypothetical protein VGO62_09885 [Myxococcota bacterium]|jgi:hypothetical protein
MIPSRWLAIAPLVLAPLTLACGAPASPSSIALIALQPSGPACAIDDDTPLFVHGLYDLSSSAPYVIALKTDADGQNAATLFTGAHVVLTDNSGTALLARDVSIDSPNSEAPVPFPPPIFARLVSPGDSALLRAANADAVDARVSLEGQIVDPFAGTNEPVVHVATSTFTAPIALCDGCLTAPPACADAIPNFAQCEPGQDVPALVCP